MTALPRVLIRCKPVFHIVPYWAPSFFWVSKVNFTSAAVSGRPSLHLTPLRTVTT